MQGALKEVHREKELLERRLEDVEGGRDKADSLKLQELEVGLVVILDPLFLLYFLKAGSCPPDGRPLYLLTGDSCTS